jgi:uncharacterized lipoprotein YmbA
MRKMKKVSRWLVAGVLLALGGCATTQQFQDFVRTEFARVAGTIVGQNAQTLVQGTS